MSNHIAEQILAAVLTTVTNLTTTGTRVVRGRVYPVEESGTPALSVFMGPDTPPEPGAEGDTYPFLDCVLQVTIRAHVQASDGVLDTTLNQIRKEVVKALQGSSRLAISAVINLWEGETAEPEMNHEGNQRSAMQDMTWFVKYRRLYTDPSES